MHGFFWGEEENSKCRGLMIQDNPSEWPFQPADLLNGSFCRQNIHPSVLYQGFYHGCGSGPFNAEYEAGPGTGQMLFPDPDRTGPGQFYGLAKADISQFFVVFITGGILHQADPDPSGFKMIFNNIKGFHRWPY